MHFGLCRHEPVIRKDLLPVDHHANHTVIMHRGQHSPVRIHKFASVHKWLGTKLCKLLTPKTMILTLEWLMFMFIKLFFISHLLKKSLQVPMLVKIPTFTG